MTRKGRIWTAATLGAMAVLGVAAWQTQPKELPLPTLLEAKLISKNSYWPAVCDAGQMEVITRTYALDFEGDLVSILRRECEGTEGCEIGRNSTAGERLDFRMIGSDSSFEISKSPQSGWIIEKFTTIIHPHSGPGQAWM